MRKYCFIFLLFVVFCRSSHGQSASDVYFPQEVAGQYKIDWIERDVLEADEKLHTIDISTFDQENVRLFIGSDAEFHVFNNDTLLFKSSPDFIDVSVDSLSKLLNSDSISVLLSDRAEILHYGLYRKVQINPSFNQSIEIRPAQNSGNQLNNTFIILLIIFSLLVVSLKLSFSKRFQDVFSLSRNFSFRPYEGDSARLRLFDQDGIFVSVLYTFAAGIIIYLFFHSSNAADNAVIQDSKSLFDFVRVWGALIALLLLKLILIFTMSVLYRSAKINTFYIKELLNISTFLISLLLIFTAAIYLFNGYLPGVWWPITRNVLVFFYIIRVILVYFKILKLSGFTNVYLFSYFCTTEIFPFVIGLKYFY